MRGQVGRRSLREVSVGLRAVRCEEDFSFVSVSLACDGASRDVDLPPMKTSAYEDLVSSGEFLDHARESALREVALDAGDSCGRLVQNLLSSSGDTRSHIARSTRRWVALVVVGVALASTAAFFAGRNLAVPKLGHEVGQEDRTFGGLTDVEIVEWGSFSLRQLPKESEAQEIFERILEWPEQVSRITLPRASSWATRAVGNVRARERSATNQIAEKVVRRSGLAATVEAIETSPVLTREEKAVHIMRIRRLFDG